MCLKKIQSTQQLINEYFAIGGVITICKPKLAPKRRLSKRTIFTRDQMNAAIGLHRPFSRFA